MRLRPSLASAHLSADISVGGSEDITFAAGATAYETPRGPEASSAWQTGAGQPSASAADVPDIGMTPNDTDVSHTEAGPATRRFIEDSLPSSSSDKAHVGVSVQVMGSAPEPEVAPRAGQTCAATHLLRLQSPAVVGRRVHARRQEAMQTH